MVWSTVDIVAVGADGVAEVVLAHVETTVPYSIDWLPDGTLLIVSGQGTSLLRRNINGSLVAYGDLSAYGSMFNEIVVDALGNAFVSGENVVVVRPDGSCAQVADGLQFGNGMAVTPDGRTLIGAEIAWDVPHRVHDRLRRATVRPPRLGRPRRRRTRRWRKLKTASS